jgi:site-specific recombinase XerD
MSEFIRKRKEHYKNIRPQDPNIQAFNDWLPENRSMYGHFRLWLKTSSYSDSAINIYSVAARQAIGFLQKPYREINPEVDLQSFLEYLSQRDITFSSLDGYRKGLAKFAEFLYLRQGKKIVEKAINWDYYLNTLPDWLAGQVQAYIIHCQKRMLPERRIEGSKDIISPLTSVLRYFNTLSPLSNPSQITPGVWEDYLDMRLLEGRNPSTLNGQLALLKALLHYLEETGNVVCKRMFLIDKLHEPKLLPKDVSIDKLKILFTEIQSEACSSQVGFRWMGRMDLAWFLLMVFSGLRTGEVRRLKMTDIDWERRQIRIEQSKGLKDRIVFLNGAAINAIKSYLEIREPTETLSQNIFIYRHGSLSQSYCFQRLHTYAQRCGVLVTPHQLRHSCATLLLNNGAPVTTVQAILGHKYIDTTLGYARLYDGTLAADYYRAMREVERRVSFVDMPPESVPDYNELVVMVDALRRGTLNEDQLNLTHAIREGLLALARKEQNINDVKVLVESS